MKPQLFTVFLGTLLSVTYCAPSDIKTRASSCLFRVEELENPCPEKNHKISIPCESMCNHYYECDNDRIPRFKDCGSKKNFNATTLTCEAVENVICRKADPPTITTSATSSAPTSVTGSITSSSTPQTTPITPKPSSAANTANSAIVFVMGVAMATIARDFL